MSLNENQFFVDDNSNLATHTRIPELEHLFTVSQGKLAL